MPNSVEIWRGPSELDGSPIIVLASGLETASTNDKTGAMLQTYILRADMRPTDAVRMGADDAICGDCMHRGNGDGSGRTCYVNYGQGPLSVYDAWARGNVPIEPNAVGVGAGRKVRIGTYGGPDAVPDWLWRLLLWHADGNTGYTHQWRKFPRLRHFCMASVDSAEEACEAHALGWRTFRVAMPGDIPRLWFEANCPAGAEMGKLLQCEDCMACCGTRTGRKGSIVIQAHGGFAVMANVRKRARS